MRQVDGQVQLQLWQYIVELYVKTQTERKELAVPGITRQKPHTSDTLFTEEDVKAQRMEQILQR